MRRGEEHRRPAVAFAGRHEITQRLLLGARLADGIADPDRDAGDLAVAEQHLAAGELERFVLRESGERGHTGAAPLVEEPGARARVGVVREARDDRLQQQRRDEEERGRAEQLERADERAGERGVAAVTTWLRKNALRPMASTRSPMLRSGNCSASSDHPTSP